MTENNNSSAPRILIVEDHAALRESLVNWLVNLFPDIVVSQAATGEESLALAGRIKPHVILMDIGLPGINGIEATQEIKLRGIETDVVVLTNLVGSKYKQDAKNAGAIEFISKQEMNAKLPAVLSQLMVGKLEK